MLKKYLGNIPWTAATVQTALVGMILAWVAYFQHGITLDKAVGATVAGLVFIYQRRATEKAMQSGTFMATLNNGNISGDATKTLPLLLLCAALASCATPSATQGQAGQGGSITAPPILLTVNVGTGGGVYTTMTSAPTAAPAATSTASAEQRATNDTRASAALGDSALKALVPAADVVPVLGEKKPKPVEVPAPPVVAPTPEHP